MADQIMLHEMTYEGLQRSAEQVVSTMQRILNVTLRYDLASVQWLDGYITRNRAHIGDENRASVVRLFGAYIGESMVREYRGAWSRDAGSGLWIVSLGEEGWVNPFALVETHLMNGESDSVGAFFSQIPAIFGIFWYHGV